MKRLLTTAALLTVLLLMNAQANGRGPCTDDRYEVHGGMSVSKRHLAVDRLIRCAENRWSVPGGYSKAEAVADCESSDFPSAIGGNNYGIYQISSWNTRVRYWLHSRHRWFPRWVHHGRVPRWHEERANVLVGIRWASRLGWGAWSCA